MINLHDIRRHAIVVAVQTSSVSDGEFERSLDELRRLAHTLDIDVAATITQKRDAADAAAYLGKGKREELKQLVAERQCNTLLVEHELTPSQAHHLEEETSCEVLDRTQVILDIFQRHACSRLARAQVELVRIQYLAPRLRESGQPHDRQRGRGAGESMMELDRRRLRDRVAELNVEIRGLSALPRIRRERRIANDGLARVALVGYTNAGKSSWMRALTGSDVLIADRLFATLDTTVRALHPATVPRILVSDTVGFIRNLPHGLVASFKSTLDEAAEASLLLHVADASDPAFSEQIAVTERVLGEIGAADVPRLLLFNKIDRVTDEAAMRQAIHARWPSAHIASAHRPDDVRAVHGMLLAHFSQKLVEDELRVAWHHQSLRREIFAHCQVLGERAADDAAFFRVRAAPDVLARIKEQIEPPA
jgi:GTP-binding protein HflX